MSSAGGLAGGADALRLHGLRGERSNVPRDSAALYEAGERLLKKNKVCERMQ